MKKYLLLTLLTTLATISLSNPSNVTYNEATLENKQQTNTNKNNTNGYKLMPFYLKLPNDDSKYNISFVGDQIVTEKLGTYTFKQKLVVPKGDNIVIFSSRRDSLQDAGKFANGAPTNTNNGDRLDASITHDVSYNNVPIFLYAYNKDTQKLEAIYFEDGTKAHYRNIITEDITKTTKEQKEDANFKFTDGYVRADEIHLTGIGKIQDTTQGVKANLDKANHLVTGKTVYDYIQGLNNRISKLEQQNKSNLETIQKLLKSIEELKKTK